MVRTNLDVFLNDGGRIFSFLSPPQRFDYMLSQLKPAIFLLSIVALLIHLRSIIRWPNHKLPNMLFGRLVSYVKWAETISLSQSTSSLSFLF